MPPPRPTPPIGRSPAWRALAAHRRAIAGLHMRDLFAADPGRFRRFSLRFEDLLLDYSKNRITADTMTLLYELARTAGVKEWTERMFRGEGINSTEDRPALHIALRNRGQAPILVEGVDVMGRINAVLAKMRAFTDRVRAGALRGYTGKPIAAVVNLGVGGSDLGPRMVCEALSHLRQPGLDVHFVSNVDGRHIGATLARLDPATTLFIVASKTFATAETLTNAATARAWLLAAMKDEAAVARQFVAVTANRAAACGLGVDPESVFELWDWVGGRFSLWSAIGLPIALAVGMDDFERLLAGAHAMDRHFQDAPIEDNLPVILALIGIWYTNFFGAECHAVLPYDQGLARFPAYLQQADMESNGKSVDREGRAVEHSTGPVIFGAPGTDAQHAFYQLLHQGTRLVPADFIAAALSAVPIGRHHDILIANFLAHSEALMAGKTAAEARAELKAAGLDAGAVERLWPHRACPGNRPTNSILFRRLDPATLGALIALYEHKIFVQGVIWGINSFDQWGVELGKQLAQRVLPALAGPAAGLDGSTAGLIDHYKALRAEG
ncbi:MAG: glucose-6-phosphate isomerase [Pseudomonadota bacterium]